MGLAGPLTGIASGAYAYTAALASPPPNLPVTCVWQATGQSPVTHTGGLSDTVVFAWSTGGSKNITVTASNALNAAGSTIVATIDSPATATSTPALTPLAAATPTNTPLPLTVRRIFLPFAVQHGSQYPRFGPVPFQQISWNDRGGNEAVGCVGCDCASLGQHPAPPVEDTA